MENDLIALSILYSLKWNTDINVEIVTETNYIPYTFRKELNIQDINDLCDIGLKIIEECTGNKINPEIISKDKKYKVKTLKAFYICDLETFDDNVNFKLNKNSLPTLNVKDLDRYVFKALTLSINEINNVFFSLIYSNNRKEIINKSVRKTKFNSFFHINKDDLYKAISDFKLRKQEINRKQLEDIQNSKKAIEGLLFHGSNDYYFKN